MAPQSYECTVEKETVRVHGLKELVSTVGALLVDPQPEFDWGAVTTLPAGSTFYVADARNFGIVMEVQVVKPVFKPGTMVFGKGKVQKY